MAGPEGVKKVRIGLFWVLSVLLVLLVVVPLVSYSWKTIDTSRDFIEESLRERQLKTAIPAASHIENLMEAHQSHLTDLAGTFEVYANDAQYKTNFEGLLQRGILGRNLSDNTLLLSYQDPGGGPVRHSLEGHHRPPSRASSRPSSCRWDARPWNPTRPSPRRFSS